MNNLNILMKDISIEFPGVKALDKVNMNINSGEVHALIGANGAGKSTLMKVLSGSYTHWEGEILINDEVVEVKTVLDAKNYGIETVHQEVDVALIPYLSVAENIMIDQMIQDMDKKHIVNWSFIKKEAKKALNNLNVTIDINKIVEDCTLAEKQMILIARSISRDCKVLILDEPTAPLSVKEADELFTVVRDLRAKGVAIIFISHRLPEIYEISDKITIMRDGKFVVEEKISNITEKEVVNYMLGRSMDENYPKFEAEIGDVVFEVKNLSDKKILKDISMNARSGEIVGVGGLVGAGKTELSKALFGAEPLRSGMIYKNGEEITLQSPVHAVKHKIALIPEERRKEGILVTESIMKNLTLPSLMNFTKNSFMLFKKEKEHSKSMIQEIGIKTPNEHQKVKNLSGGNQQKVVVGKWLISDADIYIFDEPTKGVDVGSKRDIFELIGKLAQAGKTVIYISCENAELLNITDRIYVMYDGRIVKEVDTVKTSEDEILYYSAGGKNYESQ